MSTTVTVWVHVAMFPELSVTVQVTVVGPAGKVAGALFVTLATAQLSLVTGVLRITPVAVQAPASGFIVSVAGQVIVGSVTSGVSPIVTDVVAVQPLLSVGIVVK